MIYVRGYRSAIAEELSKLVPIEPVLRKEAMPDDGERYLFCHGVIRQTPPVKQSMTDMVETFWVNCARTIKECDRLLEVNPIARICIIGSESAFKWSFDGAYAAAKAGIHRYVEKRRLKYPDQQLVCVAPTCINNTRMNQQRNEDGLAALKARLALHPKKRWLEPEEVARMVHFLLYVDKGYTTNTIIRMNGGEHCV